MLTRSSKPIAKSLISAVPEGPIVNFIKKLIYSGSRRNYSKSNQISFTNTNGVSTFRSYHNYNQMSDSLVKEISDDLRHQNYDHANKRLSKLTKNILGVCSFQNENQLALYLHGLLILDTKQHIEDVAPVILASNNGFQQAHLLLATISYLGLIPPAQIGNYETLLAKYDPTKDWKDTKLVNSVIESYLIELVELTGSNFAHYALGKFYLQTLQYERAMKHLNIAIERNFKNAILEQAILLRNGSPDGVIPKNPVKSLEMLKQVQCYRKAHEYLIEMFKNGEGLEAPRYWRAVYQTFLFQMFKFRNRTRRFFHNFLYHVGMMFFESGSLFGFFLITSFVIFMLQM